MAAVIIAISASWLAPGAANGDGSLLSLRWNAAAPPFQAALCITSVIRIREEHVINSAAQDELEFCHCGYDNVGHSNAVQRVNCFNNELGLRHIYRRCSEMLGIGILER